MAKVTYINSILSGKLGGLVYAFNKAGNYVRTFRKGTDPATSAQLNNRASFTSASTSWHSLSDAQKAVWNSFAITNFKPKLGSSGVRFSGFNAFVSTRNVSANLNSKLQSAIITTPAGITFVPGMFTTPNDAPIHPLSADIQTHAGAPLQLVMTNCVLTGATMDTTLSFNLIGPSGPGPIGGAPVFLDAIGSIPCGIAVVASLPIEQNQQFVSNPDINLVSVISPIGTLTGTWSGSVIEFSVPGIPELLNRKLGYQTGDIVQFKAYLVGENGMTQPLNSVKSTVL